MQDLKDLHATSSTAEARQLTFMKDAIKEEDSSDSSQNSDGDGDRGGEKEAEEDKSSSSSGDKAKDYVARHGSDAESDDEDEGPLMD